MFFFVQVFQVQSVWRKTCEIFPPWSRLSKDCCTCDQWHHHQVTFWTWQKRNIFLQGCVYIYIHIDTFSDWNNDGNLPKFDISHEYERFQLPTLWFNTHPGDKNETTKYVALRWSLLLIIPKKKDLKNLMWMNNGSISKKGKKKKGGTSVSLFTWSSSCAMRRCASKSRWQVSEKTCIENCCKWTKRNRKACSKILEDLYPPKILVFVSQGKFQKCHREQKMLYISAFFGCIAWRVSQTVPCWIEVCLQECL